MQRSVAGLALAMAMVGAACGGDGDETSDPATSEPGGAGDTSIAVTEKDFAIAVDPGSAGAGAVTFAVTNEGPTVHEFVVIKTDLAPDALPVQNGVVDESSPDLDAVDELEDVAVDGPQTLDMNLEAGAYVLICNLPGHYEQGMHTAFTAS